MFSVVMLSVHCKASPYVPGSKWQGFHQPAPIKCCSLWRAGSLLKSATQIRSCTSYHKQFLSDLSVKTKLQSHTTEHKHKSTQKQLVWLISDYYLSVERNFWSWKFPQRLELRNGRDFSFMKPTKLNMIQHNTAKKLVPMDWTRAKADMLHFCLKSGITYVCHTMDIRIL